MDNYKAIIENLEKFYEVGIKVTYDNFNFKLEKTKNNVQIVSSSPFSLSENYILDGYALMMDSLVLGLVQQNRDKEIDIKNHVQATINKFNERFSS